MTHPSFMVVSNFKDQIKLCSFVVTLSRIPQDAVTHTCSAVIEGNLLFKIWQFGDVSKVNKFKIANIYYFNVFTVMMVIKLSDHIEKSQNFKFKLYQYQVRAIPPNLMHAPKLFVIQWYIYIQSVIGT